MCIKNIGANGYITYKRIRQTKIVFGSKIREIKVS